MKMWLSFAIVFLLLASGCSSVMEYTPQPYDSESGAKETIKRVIMAQPGINAPVDIVITDEYIKVFCRKTRRGPGGGFVSGNVIITGPRTDYGAAPIMIYYQYFGEMKLFKRRDYYVVMIYDHSGAYRYRVITYMLDEAKSFIDALNFIISEYKD